MTDPRTPVIVGVAQSNRRPTEAELTGGRHEALQSLTRSIHLHQR